MMTLFDNSHFTLNPKVSICCITYNHAKYIKRAIDSFINQKVNFDYEIIIGEDDSNDGTREICQDYALEYPDRIKLLLMDRTIDPLKKLGLYGNTNFIKTFKECRGKYIAICEGDDFWLDVNKLQIQFDFLEKNQSFSLCGSHVTMSNEFGKIIGDYPTINPFNVYPFEVKNIYHLADYIYYPYEIFHTSSIMMRNYPDLISNPKRFLFFSGTFALSVKLLFKGKGYLFNQCMSQYTLHNGGVFSSSNKINNTKHILNDYRLLQREIPIKRYLKPLYKYQYVNLGYEYAKNGNIVFAITYYLKSLFYNSPFIKDNFLKRLKKIIHYIRKT